MASNCSKRLCFVTFLLLIMLQVCARSNVPVWVNAAPTFYVAPSGDDANPGTLSQPWLTIQYAAETMVAGDTVLIRSGVYNERVFTVRGGSSSGYITFSAYPGEAPIIDGTGVTTGNNGFLITHSYIKLLGLEICNWADNGIWAENAGYLEISDCKVHDVWYGIGLADGTHDFVLNRVEMYNFNLYGFDASPSGGADCYRGTLNDCVAHTGRDRSANVDGYALGHGTQHDFVLNRCVAYDVFDGFAISARDTTLSRCAAYDCWSTGFKLYQDNVTLVNCLSYHTEGANVELDWDGDPGTTTLRNCHFVDCTEFNVWVENSGDHLHMYNCILAGGDNIGLTFEQMGVTNYRGNYNIFHNDNAEMAIVVGYEDEFSLNQIAAGTWATYSGQDQHSLVFTDPASQLFQDLANWDLHLVEGSIAIDAGTSLNAPSVDYDGQARPQGAGYDIGAYEYSGTQPPPVSPPNISILSPENQTYSAADVPLTFSVDVSVLWIGYSLDGSANVTITGNTTLSALSAGSHSVIVYARDAAGNTGASGMLYFSIGTPQPQQQPPPFPIEIVVVAVGAIAVVGAVVVYFMKFRK